MYLNKAVIIGNLTRDPETKALPSGMKVTSFSVATNRYWKDKQTGERKESTDFHNIVVFGAQADAAGTYLKKGQQVMIEGRIQTRSWDGPDGKKNYRTEIVADNVQFGAKAGATPSSSFSGGGEPVGAGKNTNEDVPNTDSIDYPDDDIDPEDIPF